MKYSTPADFRTALEIRLRNLGGPQHAAQVRLRKMVSFDRYLARLAQEPPGTWMLKGGFALELRLPGRARTTKDIDLHLTDPGIHLHEFLVRAGRRPMGDWFEFEVERPAAPDAGLADDAQRFTVRAFLDGRLFDQFHIDAGRASPIAAAADTLLTTAPLAFAGLAPTQVPCFPLHWQIAEKLHAWVRTHPGGTSSRPKDLIDILLIASLSTFEPRVLRDTIGATFAAGLGANIPSTMPPVPAEWRVPYARLARDLDLPYRDLETASRAVREFLEPVFAGTARGRWDPLSWRWSTEYE